jgi:predicted nucleotidyltransferase
MKPSDALHAYRDVIRCAVDSHHVCNARVFGSAAHGNDLDGSDLDLLVDTLPGTTLFDLGGLQVELEERLGIPIDVLTPGDLRKPCRYERGSPSVSSVIPSIARDPSLCSG